MDFDGRLGLAVLAFLAASLAVPATAETLTGADAFGGWQDDAPGVVRLIRPGDLPPPDDAGSSGNGPGLVARTDEMVPTVPEGFAVSLFASDLVGPRTIRVAPNGDIFVAESSANRIRVFRAADGAEEPSENSVFAEDLDYPFGIAFHPPGAEPEWVYVGNAGSVVRFPYRNGDLVARGEAEVVVNDIPTGGHSTRGLAFSPDGATMFLAVGSRSNVGQSMGDRPEGLPDTPPGIAWGEEADRATVLAFNPDGGNRRIYATGIRNCSGLDVEPATGEVWCAVNERDGLGDDLVPDFVTRVREGAFYGWPWYYIGDNEDPRHAGARPDVAGKVTVPDVLIQAHSAPLGIAFYEADYFPSEYRGDGFVTLRGSWNRSDRTGYKVVRILTENGVPTGAYEDFMAGFVIDDRQVWGRPVGVAVAKDGALLVGEDGSGTIWRVSHQAGG